jgi:hypothetical protein
MARLLLCYMGWWVVASLIATCIYVAVRGFWER